MGDFLSPEGIQSGPGWFVHFQDVAKLKVENKGTTNSFRQDYNKKRSYSYFSKIKGDMIQVFLEQTKYYLRWLFSEVNHRGRLMCHIQYFKKPLYLVDWF